MYITRRWLNKFIDLTGVKDNEITKSLNTLGFEVESYKDYSKLNDKLKIVHVGNVTPIEGTHLNFCFIDSGEDLVVPVVCGAPNIKEGDYVIWAEPGKTISTGQTLSQKEIKGKISEGMICSLTEIGMNTEVQNNEDLEGIYKIHTKDESYKLIGSDAALDKIGFLDSVWEVDLTLNRSDALSAFQLLKEVANYFKKDIKNYFENFEIKINNTFKKIDIKIHKESEKLIKYLAYSFINLKDIFSIDKYENFIYSSDDIWLKFNGVKKEDNFFENIANMLAIETGQPVLILDADKIDKLEYVKINDGEKEFLQLNSNGVEVSKIGISIVDEFKPNLKTKNLLTIFAGYDNVFMRNQQKVFNANTVALQRFTKPLSNSIVSDSAKRLIYILDRYKIFSSTSGLIDVIKPEIIKNVIRVSVNFINKLIGVSLSSKEIIDLFELLDFNITIEEDILVFEVDPKRTDISNSSDICEEVARLYGYDNIESKPPCLIANSNKKDLNLKIKNQLDSYLYGNGFNNIKSYSLISEENNNKWNLFGIEKPIKLMSPLSKFKEIYRTNLSWSIIDTAGFNAARGTKNLKLYEFADIYNLNGLREKHLSILISGTLHNEKYNNLHLKSSFYYIKGILEQIITSYNLNISDITFEEMKKRVIDIHPYICYEVFYLKELIGFVYKLNPRFEQSLKLDHTYVSELNISKIETLKKPQILISEISKFQKSTRDITFVLDDKVKFIDVVNKSIKNLKNLVSWDLIDIYVDELLEKENKRSITISLQFNSNINQLKEEDINSDFAKVVDCLKKDNIEVK
ncbi:phenylalanyl-tRNA synthetase subunit beta [Spiroplasma corruscae]|uniref:Phenylalanine--tRNA ligase beta subunit n=1 Tax=Spiroplasma corruscae TaxID=216934 RepID=A0A222ENY1_9MOLU|nr:phenylalanine--tRNA ligase subunit beta [Spiroplasma corruscae]ASP28004.1 phenylalanyl-tRNA synthetase subunit beta [Spiroplasma corruscae]